MTTWTTQDRIEAEEEYHGIPFFGWVKVQDKEDTERMLREQNQILQSECQRLRKKLHAAGIHD